MIELDSIKREQYDPENMELFYDLWIRLKTKDARRIREWAKRECEKFPLTVTRKE